MTRGAGPGRDRRGRGSRRGLYPPYAVVGGRTVALPARRGRRAGLDERVREALEPLMSRWGAELGRLDVAVEDVPPELTGDEGVVLDRTAGGSVPLARTERGSSLRLVVYRRPLELRAQDETDLEELVHDVVVEALAELLGREADEIDPQE